MGLGGNLMWTAVFREVWERQKNSKLKIIPKNNGKIVKDILWDNNPYITYNKTYKPQYILDLSSLAGHGTKNLKLSDNKKDKYLDNSHIIMNRCKHYGINNPKLKCEIYFTENEMNKVEDIIKTLPNQFICIEPHSKNTYTKNKFYPFKKWEKIRESITKYPVVQIGVKDKKILNNVINLTGKLTFRETSYLLKKSILFLGIEGGLGHCCNAVDCMAIILVPPIFHPKIITYPKIQYIWLGIKEHKQCGMRVKCIQCHNIINNHNEKEVINKINLYLEE